MYNDNHSIILHCKLGHDGEERDGTDNCGRRPTCLYRQGSNFEDQDQHGRYDHLVPQGGNERGDPRGGGHHSHRRLPLCHAGSPHSLISLYICQVKLECCKNHAKVSRKYDKIHLVIIVTAIGHYCDST